MSEILWTPGMTLEQIEKHVIQKAFIHYRENKTATAKALGISVRTLDTKLQQYAEEYQAQLAKDEIVRQKNEDFLARARGQVVPPKPAAPEPSREEIPFTPMVSPPQQTPKPHEPMKISIDHNKRRGR